MFILTNKLKEDLFNVFGDEEYGILFYLCNNNIIGRFKISFVIRFIKDKN